MAKQLEFEKFGVIRFWQRVDRTGGKDACWNWKLGRDQDGYGTWKNRKRHKYCLKAHRLAWQYTNGQIPEGLMVCHKCDNPACCNPKHLFLGTAKDNAMDAVKKNRHAYGERNYGARLKESEVIKIIALLKQGKNQKELSKQFGCSPAAINKINTKRTWGYLPR